jgi:hypothetical protein
MILMSVKPPQMLWQNSPTKVSIVVRSLVALLYDITVEFRDFLHVCIPQFVTILKDSNTEVCTAGVHALVQLSEEGDLSMQSAVVLLRRIAAESRDAIQGSIPHIVGFLKAGDGDLRQAGANALSKLSGNFLSTLSVVFRSNHCSSVSRLYSTSTRGRNYFH